MSDIFIEYAIHILRNPQENIAEGAHASICNAFRNCALENDKISAYNNWRTTYINLYPQNAGAINSLVDDTIDAL